MGGSGDVKSAKRQQVCNGHSEKRTELASYDFIPPPTPLNYYQEMDLKISLILLSHYQEVLLDLISLTVGPVYIDTLNHHVRFSSIALYICQSQGGGVTTPITSIEADLYTASPLDVPVDKSGKGVATVCGKNNLEGICKPSEPSIKCWYSIPRRYECQGRFKLKPTDL